MTCVEAAREFEAVVAERLTRRGKPAMRYEQMNRIAQRLRRHGGERRFEDDLRGMFHGLNSLQLLLLEVAMNDWWGWPAQ